MAMRIRRAANRLKTGIERAAERIALKRFETSISHAEKEISENSNTITNTSVTQRPERQTADPGRCCIIVCDKRGTEQIRTPFVRITALQHF